MSANNTNSINISLNVTDNELSVTSSIEEAILNAELESLTIKETIETVEKIKPNCDKLDYALAASSGVLCGIIDIFLVGKPGESPIGDITDKWFEARTMDFAKLFGWEPNIVNDEKLSSAAIRFLEKKFKVPYDQTGAGDAGRELFDLNPNNHHFKSLGHNPSLMGLFFSILDQFSMPNSSHFVAEGELISLIDANNSFVLRGNNIVSKFFCGFVNWFGHIISDISGSSSSKGRGMGVPSPLWTWTNDIIAIKRKLNIPVLEFDKNINELAVNIFTKGYDIRFQTAQVIPVIVNEMIVRFIYSIRRLIKCCKEINLSQSTFEAIWSKIEPFSNSTVTRMLTVAHGSFCAIDIGDATFHGLASVDPSNMVEFVLHLNIVGIGRFSISLWGETKRGLQLNNAKQKAAYAKKCQIIVDDYLDGLRVLYELYDDELLLTFVEDFKNNNSYKEAFQKSVELSKKRCVPNEDLLYDLSDIDEKFGRNMHE